jgi:FtsZ-binding cell division protein ZapB
MLWASMERCEAQRLKSSLATDLVAIPRHSLYNRDLQRAADMEKKRVDQIASLEVENHALEDDNNVLIQENQSLREENERLRRESQELQRRLSGCDDHMRELEDLRKRMAELQALREENKRLGRENQELQRRLSGCDDHMREIEDLRKRMAELQARLRAQPTQPSAPSPPPQGGRLAGIGLMLEREGHNPRVIISGVTAGGPAAKSGLIQVTLFCSYSGNFTFVEPKGRQSLKHTDEQRCHTHATHAYMYPGGRSPDICQRGVDGAYFTG